MKNLIAALLTLACFSAGAFAENFSIAALTAADIKASQRVASEEPRPGKEVMSAEENEKIYLLGAAERARILKEARHYVKAEKELQAPVNAFLSPAPAEAADQAAYAALREKNAGYLRNVGYWREQVKSLSPNLEYALGVNDLATANILINHMRHDHYAIAGETEAIRENNRKARNWPMKPSNEQLYQAGAQERAAILAQAAACAGLEGREIPENAFLEQAPAGTADLAGYAALREKNADFIGNITYWRYQLEGNYGNLKEAVKANDLETARILLGHLKADSAALDNEIEAVERNNEQARKF